MRRMNLRSAIYDAAIVPMTARWYARVLALVPGGGRLLDVGIGTGAALARNAGAVRAKGLRVLGIDIDPAYVRSCRRRMERAGLADAVAVEEVPFEAAPRGPYDVVYFSGSFMLLPDPAAALDQAAARLAPGGRVAFTQTFAARRSPLLEWMKPRLHWLTTVRFGRVTYPEPFFRLLGDGGFTVEVDEPLSGARGGTGRLVVARPRG